jgi:hypothetical protein
MNHPAKNTRNSSPLVVQTQPHLSGDNDSARRIASTDHSDPRKGPRAMPHHWSNECYMLRVKHAAPLFSKSQPRPQLILGLLVYLPWLHIPWWLCNKKAAWTCRRPPSCAQSQMEQDSHQREALNGMGCLVTPATPCIATACVQYHPIPPCRQWHTRWEALPCGDRGSPTLQLGHSHSIPHPSRMRLLCNVAQARCLPQCAQQQYSPCNHQH